MASRKTILPATHERGLEVYFRDINRYSLLTREEEVSLACRIQTGDEEALKILVRANLRFVVSVAKRYTGQGLLLSDLINEGNLGLLKAAGRFDEKRGYRFISYAVWWIRQSIMQALLDKSRTVRLPQNQTALLLKIHRTRQVLQNEGIPNPDADQIALRLEVDPEDVRWALRSDRVEMGLDDIGTDGTDRPLREVLEDENQPSPELGVLERGLREDVRRALSCLTERERQIIIQYFGLSFEDAQTLQVIGERLGLTRERVRQIKEKALEKMRTSTSREILLDYY
ncbi:MAG: RNA polymerase sigma factor RpoD/SigA [Candidatus Krumholzibacteriia bacterium]